MKDITDDDYGVWDFIKELPLGIKVLYIGMMLLGGTIWSLIIMALVKYIFGGTP